MFGFNLDFQKILFWEIWLYEISRTSQYLVRIFRLANVSPTYWYSTRFLNFSIFFVQNRFYMQKKVVQFSIWSDIFTIPNSCHKSFRNWRFNNLRWLRYLISPIKYLKTSSHGRNILLMSSTLLKLDGNITNVIFTNIWARF